MIAERIYPEVMFLLSPEELQATRSRLRQVRAEQKVLEREFESRVLAWYPLIKEHEYGMILLSENPNATWDFVQKTQAWGWNYYQLSANPRMKWGMQTPDFDWSVNNFLKNGSVKLDFLHQHWSEVSQMIDSVSCNPNITPEFIAAHSHCWDYNSLSSNIHFGIDFVRRHPEKRFSFEDLCANPAYTWENILELAGIYHQTLPEEISLNPNCRIEIVRANPNLPWSSYLLSMNPGITWTTMQANPDFFSIKGFSSNPTLTWQIFDTYPDLDWCLPAIWANGMGREALDQEEEVLLRRLGMHQCKEFYYRLIARMNLPGGFHFKMDIADFQRSFLGF